MLRAIVHSVQVPADVYVSDGYRDELASHHLQSMLYIRILLWSECACVVHWLVYLFNRCEFVFVMRCFSPVTRQLGWKELGAKSFIMG